MFFSKAAAVHNKDVHAYPFYSKDLIMASHYLMLLSLLQPIIRQYLVRITPSKFGEINIKDNMVCVK
jgi:hypothetical protein